jgi:hypothetical protein
MKMCIPQKLLRISILVIFSFFLSWQNGFSFSVVRISTNENNPAEIKTPGYLKASVFVNLSARQFTAATGKKLNFFQKIYFRVVQRQMKRDLRTNPDLLITDYFDPKKVKFKFDFLWFVIASIIGPLGVLLAYTSHENPKSDMTPKKDRITSAWLGFLFWVLWFGFLFIF